MSEMNGPLANLDEIDSPLDINQLKELDNFLKCSICYEYFNTCVITECSHNFCSVCIRKYILYKTECPVCFSELYDSQLRANRIIDNFVAVFPPLKERIIRRIRTLKTLKPNCVYVSPSKNPDFKTPGPRTPKKRHSILNSANTELSAEEDTASLFVDEGSSKNLTLKINTPTTLSQNKVIIPKIFQSPVKKNSPVVVTHHTGTFVECPVCMVEIPQRNINSHLDDCLKRSNNCSKQESSPVEKRAHLPKLVFRLMSASALRSKAKEYGLNSHGDIDTLKTRIQKFTVLYNAECDKLNPRPVHEIIRQLEKEEKILASQKLPRGLFTSQADNPTAKEELNALYLKENKSSFEELIKSVKRRNASDSKERVDESKSSLVVEPCEPSTSRAGVDDLFQVEEVKIEPFELEPSIKVDVDFEAGFSGNENDASDDELVFPVPKKKCKRNKRLGFDDYDGGNEHNASDDELVFPASKKKCKRSKRLDFDDCDKGLEPVDPIFVNVEQSGSVFDALTDEDDVFNNSRTSEPDNRSPVLQKRTRRKRQPVEEPPPAKQSQRKRKR